MVITFGGKQICDVYPVRDKLVVSWKFGERGLDALSTLEASTVKVGGKPVSLKAVRGHGFWRCAIFISKRAVKHFTV